MLPKLNKNAMLQNRYVIANLLGKGAFGSVYEAFDTQFNVSVAIKAVSKAALKANKKVKELFESEVAIIQKLRNDNIVGFHDYFEHLDSCYLVLEFCNEGDLEQHWIKNG